MDGRLEIAPSLTRKRLKRQIKKIKKVKQQPVFDSPNTPSRAKNQIDYGTHESEAGPAGFNEWQLLSGNAMMVLHTYMRSCISPCNAHIARQVAFRGFTIPIHR
jgi:hypothetical protein